MAVVSADEMVRERQAVATTEQATYVRPWRVKIAEVDGAPPADVECEARDAAALPSLGHPHDWDTNAVLVRKSVKPTESRLIWIVDCEYETPEAPSLLPNPLNDPVSITWGVNEYTEVADEDKDGDPILNSAKDWFDPPLEHAVYLPVVTMVRNDATFNPNIAVGYVGSVNKDAVTIAGYTAGARKARCLEYGGKSAERNGVAYYVVTYRIEFNYKRYDRSVVDQGIRRMDGAGKKVRINVGNVASGEPVTEPVRLDGNGVPLADDAAPDATIYRTFRIETEKTFAALNLPVTT